MIKTLGLSILIALVFVFAKNIGLLNFITKGYFFYGALFLVIAMLVAAFFVLGIPSLKDSANDDEKK